MEPTDLLEQESEQPAGKVPAFQLKGSMLTLTTLELLENDLSAVDEQLAERAAQAPACARDEGVVHAASPKGISFTPSSMR